MKLSSYLIVALAWFFTCPAAIWATWAVTLNTLTPWLALDQVPGFARFGLTVLSIAWFWHTSYAALATLDDYRE